MCQFVDNWKCCNQQIVITWSDVMAWILPDMDLIGPSAASRHRLLISEPEYPKTEAWSATALKDVSIIWSTFRFIFI